MSEIFRIEKRSDFTIVRNGLLRDKTMSLKAKGLLITMLSKPDGWDYTLNGLQTILLEGRDAIASGLTELERHGYLVRRKTRDRFGRFTDVEYISPSFERPAFGIFKGNVCHALKEQGDIQFIIQTLESGEIRKLFNKGWYEEILYLLAMLDYVSRENNVPVCSDYADIRATKLDRTVYPSSVLMLSKVLKSEDPKKKAMQEAIPEFMRFNIVEADVRNVV